MFHGSNIGLPTVALPHLSLPSTQSCLFLLPFAIFGPQAPELVVRLQSPLEPCSLIHP